MFIVGKLTEMYRKEHGIKQRYLCSFFAEKPETMYEKYSYTVYDSLLSALENLNDILIYLSDDQLASVKHEKLEEAACISTGVLYMVEGFEQEDVDDE